MHEPGVHDADVIRSGHAILGVEFGSTRIKAALIAPDATPLATGSSAWENQLHDGMWTYAMDDVWRGLAACYASLAREVEARYGVRLTTLAAIGVSGMMHGYLVVDDAGELLVPFRTWRNTMTADASARLTEVLGFAIPQRWSIAHLHRSVLEAQPHVRRIAHLSTLAGYVHWKLTGTWNVGIGEASGMFPVDPATRDWDTARLAGYDALVAASSPGWALRDVLPVALPAGEPAGSLTADGARLLDPTGLLRPGIPLCPPEGDAGTGMVATNAVRPRSGNVSAGTSVFVMVVLEGSLARVYDAIDVVVTPDGAPVAMVHSNNGSSDLDAWFGLFGEVAAAVGADVSMQDLYDALLPLAIHGDPDAGGLLSINYVSGEHITGFDEGRPLFVRKHGDPFTLTNFVRALCFASLCAVRMGLDILTEREGVVIDEIRGHGGFFKGGDTGQRMVAAALNVPVSIPMTAGEGGAWGMAVLAAFLLRDDRGQSLADFLDQHIASSIGVPIRPEARDVAGFASFFRRHARGLTIEREAVTALT